MMALKDVMEIFRGLMQIKCIITKMGTKGILYVDKKCLG